MDARVRLNGFRRGFILPNSAMKRLIRHAPVILLLLLVQCSDPVVVPDPFPTAYDGAQFDTDLLATRWYECATDCMEQYPSIADPIAARIYAYMGIALYQALVPGMPGSRSLEESIPELRGLPYPDTSGNRYHWLLAANAAIAELLRQMLPPSSLTRRRIDSLEQANIAERWIVERDTAMLERSIQYGKKLAEHVLAIAQTDGGERAWEALFPPDYQLPLIPGGWEPTSPAFGAVPLLPQWANVRLLATTDTSCIVPPPPYSTDTSSAFYRAAAQVHARSITLSDVQTDDAQYWSDPFGKAPTFPGHLMRIAAQLVRSGPYRTGFGSVLYLRLGLAMHNGYVLAWKAKYRYPLMRPETYIRRFIDPTYRPPLPSPPTPEYVSDHALVGTAVIRILEDAFRAPFPEIERITDRTHAPRGRLDRDYHTLSEVLADIVQSERLSCTQYDFSITAGEQCGEQLAAEIIARVPRHK